jgi:hypothetical protein
MISHIKTTSLLFHQPKYLFTIKEEDNDHNATVQGNNNNSRSISSNKHKNKECESPSLSSSLQIFSFQKKIPNSINYWSWGDSNSISSNSDIVKAALNIVKTTIIIDNEDEEETTTSSSPIIITPAPTTTCHSRSHSLPSSLSRWDANTTIERTKRVPVIGDSYDKNHPSFSSLNKMPSSSSSSTCCSYVVDRPPTCPVRTKMRRSTVA